MSNIITLKDGLMVEIDINENEKYAKEISSDDIIDTSIEKIQDFLLKVIKPISNTYKELDKEMSIHETKITIGVKSGAEGNFILAKSNISSNIQVEMTLKPIV
jgi:hypothetical protein